MKRRPNCDFSSFFKGDFRNYLFMYISLFTSYVFIKESVRSRTKSLDFLQNTEMGVYCDYINFGFYISQKWYSSYSTSSG